MNAAAVSYILCPRPVVKRWRGGEGGMIDNSYALARTYANATQQKDASEPSRIDKALNESGQTPYNPPTVGRQAVRDRIIEPGIDRGS